MKNFICIVLMVSAFVIVGCNKKIECVKLAKVDTVSSASKFYMLKDQMIKDEKLLALMKDPFLWDDKTVFALSTVNCNGVPNISVIVPYAIDKDALMLITKENQTAKNISETKFASALLRTVDVKAKSKYNPNGDTGCRMILKVIEDEKERARLYENYKKSIKRQAQDIKSCIFMKIIEVYPLG